MWALAGCILAGARGLGKTLQVETRGLAIHACGCWQGLGLGLGLGLPELGVCSVAKESACCWMCCAGAGAAVDAAQAGPRGGLVCASALHACQANPTATALSSLDVRLPYPMCCSFCGSLPSLHLSAELQGKPTVRKAMVVTPSSLCQNWADEARKWLGVERMRVMVLSPGPDGKQQARRGGGGAGAGSGAA